MPVTAEEKHSSWSQGICSGLELQAQVSKEMGQSNDDLAIGRTHRKKERKMRWGFLSMQKWYPEISGYGLVPLQKKWWLGCVSALLKVTWYVFGFLRSSQNRTLRFSGTFWARLRVLLLQETWRHSWHSCDQRFQLSLEAWLFRQNPGKSKGDNGGQEG